MNCLAFDLGASSGKIFLSKFDGDKLELMEVHKFKNSAIPLSKGLYWDFINIWKNLCIGIQKADLETGKKIQSLGLDTFSNDFSFVDKDGELLAPVRCYRDERTVKYADQIYDKLSPQELYMLSGNQIAPFNTLMQLGAMKAGNKDAILSSAHKMLFLPDLLAYYITGETISERTVSSVSQMYSFKLQDWSEEILSSFGLSRELFGELTSPCTVSGHSTLAFMKEWGVGGFDFVSVCEHDTASAFLSSTQENSIIISSGTWSLIGCEHHKPIINEYAYRNNIANEGGLPGRHRLIRNVMGSWLLQQLKSDFELHGKSYSYNDFESAAVFAKPFEYLIDVDSKEFFSPGNMAVKIKNKCHALYGHAPEDMAEIVRCVYDSLSMKYYWGIKKLEKLTGRTFESINILGGGSKDKLLCQLTANVANKPVYAGPSDATALGNILSQLIAHGKVKDIIEGRSLVRQSYSSDEYIPQNIGITKEKYEEFIRLNRLDDN